jgi:hypothetical protein
MSRRSIVGVVFGFVVSVVLGSIGIAQSSEPWLGTWRMNVERSKSANKSQVVRMESLPNGVRTFIDTVDAKGMKVHQEIVAYFDGKEYEVKGAAVPTTRAYKRTVRDYEYVTRVSGKVTTTSRGEVSADGRVRTIRTTGKNAAGLEVNNVNIYEKQ